MRVCDEPTRLYKNIKYVCKINSVRLADIEEPREAGTISRFEKRGNVMNLPVWILYNVYRKTGVTIEDLIEKDLTADRKTEPQTHEIRTNTHECVKDTHDKTEPTISKMEQVEDDAYFLELMGAVERGEISDAGANQAWYEYINHKDEPQTERSE